MTIVRHTLVDPAGVPIKNTQVVISLAAGPTGGFIGSTVEVLTQIWAATDQAGVWTADLTPNANLSPAGTYYIVRQLREVIGFIVPAAPAGPFWLRDCLVASPVMPAMLPSVVVGPPGPASLTESPPGSGLFVGLLTEDPAGSGLFAISA